MMVALRFLRVATMPTVVIDEPTEVVEVFGDLADLQDLLRGQEDLDPDGYGDLGTVATEDGCIVEPDGRCPHGVVSPLIRLGIM